MSIHVNVKTDEHTVLKCRKCQRSVTYCYQNMSFCRYQYVYVIYIYYCIVQAF